MTKISETAVAWAKQRGLGRATLEQLGVASGTVFFPELGRKAEALFFRYREGWKARAVPDKAFVAAKGMKLSFWNEDQVLAGDLENVFVTEGELDACSLVEAGLRGSDVLSVPNGAVERAEKAKDGVSEVRGYGYAEAALEAGLNRAKRFIWCGDGDGPGYSLRDDMVRILGPARFWFVEWPEGCKDANDVLRTEGAQYLRELVTEGAMAWPVKGIYRMNELPEPAPLALWHPGFPEWESKVFLAPRTISVVTGQPGHGKTELWAQILYQIVSGYGVPACVASFETRPKPHLRRKLRTLLIGALERNLTDADIRKADAWINEWYLFLVHPDQRPSVEWLLDMAEVAVVRHGARIIQIDPWNRLEAARSHSESETEYIGRCLRTMHTFAHDMNCHVQIVAHPAKMDGTRRGKVPDLEDLSGSKNWENMSDQGFVIHRPQMFEGAERRTEAMLYYKKSRFDELGYPCRLKLNYDLTKGKFVSTDYADVLPAGGNDG